MINTVVWSYLTNIKIGNPNSGYTEGNIQTAKKVSLPDGNFLTYISGQSQRYGNRNGLKELGEELSLPVDGSVETTLGNPEEYIDDDIFGYLLADTQRKRTSPYRVSPLVAQFPYYGDRDLLTKTRKAKKAGGNIVETEVYSNIMQGGALLELDRLGVFDKGELEGGDEERKITKEEKIRRTNLLLDVVKNQWSGGKQTNLLTDISPKFIIFTLQKTKLPYMLHKIKVDEKGYIDHKRVIEILQNYDDITEKLIIGKSTIFDCSALNEENFKNYPKVEIYNIAKSFERVKELIKEEINKNY